MQDFNRVYELAEKEKKKNLLLNNRGRSIKARIQDKQDGGELQDKSGVKTDEHKG